MMTRQEAIRNILQDDEFNKVIQELRENQINRIIYSNEGDAKER